MNYPIKTTILLALVLWCSCSSIICHASLGDTLDQCVKEYGVGTDNAPTSDDLKGSTSTSFTSNGYNIICTFWKGYCVVELITKHDVNAKLSENEAMGILLSRAQGQNWSVVTSSGGVKGWQRSDGTYAVYTEFLGGSLRFETKEYFDLEFPPNNK